MKPHEIQEKLGLTRIRDRNWYVQPSCATTGDGLCEGLTWLTSNHKSWDTRRGLKPMDPSDSFTNVTSTLSGKHSVMCWHFLACGSWLHPHSLLSYLTAVSSFFPVLCDICQGSDSLLCACEREEQACESWAENEAGPFFFNFIFYGSWICELKMRSSDLWIFFFLLVFFWFVSVHKYYSWMQR